MEQWEQLKASNDPGHDLMHWTYQYVSGAALAAGLFAYWLFGWVGYTPIGLLCTLFQCLCVGGMVYSAVRKEPLQLVSDPDGMVRAVFSAVSIPVAKAAAVAGRVLSCEDKLLTAKALVASFFLSCAESWVSLSTLFLLLWVGAFAGPLLVTKHWDQIEPHYNRVQDSISRSMSGAKRAHKEE